jgi:hypothetical protein
VYRLGQEWRRRRDEDVGERGQLVGHGGGEVAPAPQHPDRRRAGVEHRAGEDERADRMQAVLQRRHHPEVATATAQRPEQLGVLALAGGDELAVSGDHVGREQVVAGEAVLAQ